jgi:phosphopantothenoylcysteine decarboxylase / phosphopantothenate---cysteine ligase
MTPSLSNREIVLGVTGSIAAYKACEVASLLMKRGVRVQPVLTRSACELVGPATFEALTGQRAITAMFEPLQNREVGHIAVAGRVCLFLVAPATANILAKAAHGIADDWLSTALLATRTPVLFAPAMNTHMYNHPATQANIALLRERGCRFVGPAEGRLACGTEGTGKMADPQVVVEAALPFIDPRDDLAGRRVLITSGGNREPIDPARYIGNRSSGKMGRALALEALCRGAEVTVVTGPCEMPPPYGAEVVCVETAAEMAAAVMERCTGFDAVIAAAAVADYRPAAPMATKHKRDGRPVTLELVENDDIIASVAARRKPGQVIVAFAAETGDLVGNARAKLQRKGVDLLIANLVGSDLSGFGADTLTAVLLDTQAPDQDLGNAPKEAIATALIDATVKRLTSA